jgi:hypothetical protein
MHITHPHKEKSKGRHAQGLDNRTAATAMPAPHDKNSMKHIITLRSILIQNLARQVHKHRNRQGQMESTWFFTYWEAGEMSLSQLHSD